MKVALIGFSGAGMSTLYRAAARGETKGEITAVPVPDPRFDAIVAQVKPKKITPATVIFQDNLDSAQGAGSKMLSQKFLDEARKCELLLHVVRAFDSPMVAYYAEIDPLRDQVKLDEELLLMDLQMVESRLSRLAKSQNAQKSGHQDYLDRVLFERIKEPLEMGIPLRAQDLSEDDHTILRNYQFLTVKPMVVVFNVSEDQVATTVPQLQARIDELKAKNTPAFTVCATIEDEIAQLDAADQAEFLKDLGLTEPASNRIIQAVFDALGLIMFFTAGESETRAWPLRKGSTALKAAATIHNDIAKGFIRSETVHYADYEAHGSLDAAYSAGKMSLEGKEYIVQDGDLLHIRNKS